MTCVARYAQRRGAHIAAVPIAPWQGVINTRRGTIQVRRKPEGSEAGAVCACKSSGFQKKSWSFFCSPKAEVINKIGMSILVEEEGVDVLSGCEWVLCRCRT